MVLTNCDIGERGKSHPVDLALMEFIDIANIACGGHAGTTETVTFFRDLANEKKVQICAHLSFPDPENFGRRPMAIPLPKLMESLERQLRSLPEAKMVKFHGELYHQTLRDRELATVISKWIKEKDISKLIAMHPSAMSEACESRGISILREGFAERRYQHDNLAGFPQLVSRTQSHASITMLDEALKQAKSLIMSGKVDKWFKDPKTGELISESQPHPIDTLCIHSDSLIALDLAKGIKKL